MIVGDVKTFAIEFQISEAHPDDHFWALGFFIVHVNGREYGVRSDNATMLANAVDGAAELLRTRGVTVNSRLSNMTADQLADEYLEIFYREISNKIAANDLKDRQTQFLSASCLWPSYDEEFDDGSHILRFDLGSHVRVVGFKNDNYQPDRLTETRVKAEVFYDVISRWPVLFREQRLRALQRH